MYVGEDRRMEVYDLAPLPLKLQYACFGSSGSRIVAAGGLFENTTTKELEHRDSVLLLESPTANWTTVQGASLPRRKAAQAGVLVGNLLMCIGGSEDTVCQQGSVVRRCF